jgi:hypothetical protein
VYRNTAGKGRVLPALFFGQLRRAGVALRLPGTGLDGRSDSAPGFWRPGAGAISATAQSACWPVSICSPARFTPWSKNAIAVASSSNSSAHRCRVSDLYGDQADPRQSFRAHFQGNQGFLADQPAGRFEFVFTPTHGPWLNLVEGFFSKLARSVLRHIRVESKQELKDRIMAAMDEFNRHPVVHTWSYKLDQAA